MENKDSINLLKECNAGSKMATNALCDLLPHTKNQKMAKIMDHNRDRHAALGNELSSRLAQAGEQEKDPPAMAKAMSKATIGMKMMVDPSEHEIASILTDGCNMGVKSVSEYLNQYENADPDARHLAEELVGIEQELANSMKQFL